MSPYLPYQAILEHLTITSKSSSVTFRHGAVDLLLKTGKSLVVQDLQAPLLAHPRGSVMASSALLRNLPLLCSLVLLGAAAPSC